ncbi:hypothetical protein TMatcc_004717 [Talaromyces marneffei ATCC 18224]
MSLHKPVLLRSMYAYILANPFVAENKKIQNRHSRSSCRLTTNYRTIDGSLLLCLSFPLPNGV